MRRLVIYGDTAFAEEIYLIITREGKDRVVAFTNEKKFITRDNILGIPVLPTEVVETTIGKDFEVLIAYGYIKMNNLREKIYKECLSYGWSIGKYVSCNAVCFSDNIGEGTMIWPNCYIGPNVRIGLCNIIQASCTLAHDNELGDFNYLAPSVVMGGRSKVCSHSFIGLNSTVKSDVILNDYTLLGCGCNMLANSASHGCYVGNPAKILSNDSLEMTI